jgi:hypothetical protein
VALARAIPPRHPRGMDCADENKPRIDAGGEIDRDFVAANRLLPHVYQNSLREKWVHFSIISQRRPILRHDGCPKSPTASPTAT